MFTTSPAALVSKRYVRTTVLAAFLALVASTQSIAEPLAIGAVENYDAKTSTLFVLGQEFNVRSAVLTAGTKAFPISKASLLATSNALVRIDGTRAANGSVNVSSIFVLPELNAPGSTEVFLAGVVTAVRSDGTISIGALKIDVNSVSDGLEKVRVGDTIEVIGTQPSANGLVLAGGVSVARGVGGTGKLQLQGVGGTGKTLLQGVGGTGKIQLQGVGGTGKVQLQGVGGTGKAELQGVGGTGKVQLQGVGGTGKVQLQGVGGTGKVQLQGVGGTGKAELQGVGGTGKVQLQGVGGTGKVQLQGVGGTGKVQLQGVGGTGKVQLQGVGGTGKAELQGVGGTGKVQLQGVGGTGYTATF